MQTQQVEQKTGSSEKLDASELQALLTEGKAMIDGCPRRHKGGCKECKVTAFLRKTLRMLEENKLNACLRLCRDREIRNKFDLVATWNARLLVHSKRTNGRKPEDITGEALRVLAEMTT